MRRSSDAQKLRSATRAMLDAVRSAGAKIGVKTMALDVWSFNEDARAFFRSYGLTPFNERLWNLEA